MSGLPVEKTMMLNWWLPPAKRGRGRKGGTGRGRKEGSPPPLKETPKLADLCKCCSLLVVLVCWWFFWCWWQWEHVSFREWHAACLSAACSRSTSSSSTSTTSYQIWIFEVFPNMLTRFPCLNTPSLQKIQPLFYPHISSLYSKPAKIKNLVAGEPKVFQTPWSSLTHTHTHIHTDRSAYLPKCTPHHTHEHTPTHTCTHTHIYTRTYTHKHTLALTRTHAHIYKCIYICITLTHTYTYVYMCITHTHINTRAHTRINKKPIFS